MLESAGGEQTTTASPPVTLAGPSGFLKKYLVIPKLIYIGLNLLLYAVHAYGTDFFRRQWNIKLSQIGYISALSGFNFVGSIFWSGVADRTLRYKLILVTCTAAYAILMFSLNMKVFTDSTGAKIAFTAICFGLAQFFGSALFPLVDNQVMSLLAADPTLSKDTFGRQRLWGTIAHSSVTLLSNQANKWYLSLRGDSAFLQKYFGDYLGMFLVLVLSAMFFAATIIFGIPNDLEAIPGGSSHHHHQPTEKEKQLEMVMEETDEKLKQFEEEEEPVKILEETKMETITMIEPVSRSWWHSSPTARLLCIPAFLFFMLVVLVTGIVRSVMTFFQAYFIITIHNGGQKGKDQAAYTAIPRLLSEVGVFFFGKQLMRILGAHWMLIGSMGTGILRLVGYAAMPTKGAGSLILPYFLELLKGLNAGLFVSSAVRLANDMAPEGCSNTAQGLVSGNYAGLSTAFGGILGGLIVGFYPSTIEGERKGMQTMFYIISGSATVCLVLFILKFIFVDKVLCTGRRFWRRRRSTTENPA
jgi:hypothetical protein